MIATSTRHSRACVRACVHTLQTKNSKRIDDATTLSLSVRLSTRLVVALSLSVCIDFMCLWYPDIAIYEDDSVYILPPWYFF